MCDDLKRQFYSACSVWYWPVLWWQFVIMERYLARLYVASGQTEMTYGLSLGARGELRLVFLSDAARCIAEGSGRPAEPHLYAHLRATETLSLDHPCNEFSVEQDHALLLTTPTSSPLYLDPG